MASGLWDSRTASSVCSLPVQVTLFAYSDLLLFTKEDEPGRCNVLRNPLYLQSVKLQEGECMPEMPWAPSALSLRPALGSTDGLCAPRSGSQTLAFQSRLAGPCTP